MSGCALGQHREMWKTHKESVASLQKWSWRKGVKYTFLSLLCSFFFFLNDVGSHVWVTLKFSINIPSVGGLHGLDTEVAQGGV